MGRARPPGVAGPRLVPYNRMNPQRSTGTPLELLVFELAGSRYALKLADVREVVPAVMITPLPGAPEVVEGVIDVRGDLVPVYDLRARFDLPPVHLDPAEQLIVAWTGTRLVAVRCDRTQGLERVSPQSIDPAASLGTARRHLAGAARLPDGIVLIHDLPAFLDAAEQHALEQAVAAHSDPDSGSRR
jgi:purine-binding chemotaxis protein CheW